MKQPSSPSLNQQVATATIASSQITTTIDTSKPTRTNRSKLKVKSASIIYSVLFLTSFTRVTVSSFTLPTTSRTTTSTSTAIAMTNRNLRNNNASLYKKNDDDTSNLYSNLLTSSSSLGVTRRVPHVHVHAMQMQSNSNDNHSRTSSNLNGNLNNNKGLSSSPGSNSNANANLNVNVNLNKRTGSKRRQAAKTVSSLFSSFPLYFSKNSNGDIGDDSNKNINGNGNGNTATISQLQQENEILRETITQLEHDNHRLEKSHARQRIIVEQFEGEGYGDGDVVESAWWGQEGTGTGTGNGTGNDADSHAATAPVASTKRHVQFGDPESQTLNLGLTHRERGMAAAGDDRSRASSITTSSGQIPGQVQVQYPQDGEQEECDVEDDGGCPIEPDISFKAALKDRAYWLVGLLTLQSMSGLILARNELLLQTHPVIIYFLTMLVGAGGNAGNQAAVRGMCVLNYVILHVYVFWLGQYNDPQLLTHLLNHSFPFCTVIRGIALGTLNERTQRKFLNREFKMAVSLSVILSVAGFIRAVAFGTPFAETVAVTTALAIIVFTSICFGAVLPLLLRKIDVDPAHSSTSIQVIMDILGVLLTVVVSTTVLDSPMGVMIIAKLTGK